MKQLRIHQAIINLTCKLGSSVSCRSEVSCNCCVNKALGHFKTNHPQFVSLGYLNMNSVRNNFYSIPPLIEHNIDILALAETKLDSSFPESQFLLEGMKKPYRFDVSSGKGRLLCMSMRIFHQNIFEVSIFQMTCKPFPLKYMQATGCFNIQTSRSKVSIFFVMYNRFT